MFGYFWDTELYIMFMNEDKESGTVGCPRHYHLKCLLFDDPMPDLDCLMNEPWMSKICRQIMRKVFDEIIIWCVPKLLQNNNFDRKGL